MSDLVACLGTGKGTWSPVIKLVNSGYFEKAYIVTDEFGKKNFKAPDSVELIVIDRDSSVEDIKQKVKEPLEDKDVGTQIALNLSSGSGKEHMAVLAALLESGLGIRMVVPDTEEGFKEL